MTLMVEAMKAKVGNPGRKLVLVKLADNANDKGECWPSYQHVADQCEMGRSTVKSHIKALEEAGFLTVVERNGGVSSNKYRLHITKGKTEEKPKQTRSNPDPVKNKPGQYSAAPRSESDTPPRSNPDPRTSHSFEPVIEPVDDAGASSSTQAVDCADQHVDDTDVVETGEDPFLSNLFSPEPSETLPATTATAAPAGAGHRFAMHFEWVPTEWFTERCRTAGVSLQRLEPAQQEEILGEFRSYWEARGDQATQAQWEHKLLRQLQRVIGQAAGNTPGQPASRQQKRAAVTEAIMDINDTDW
jgi:biotin operon repressor